jgi:hypothetical protein
MKTFHLLACVTSLALGGAVLPAVAQTGGGAQTPSSVSTPLAPPPSSGDAASFMPSETVTESEPTRGEPNVKRTVIEDKGTRIDELKVRGQTKRITVTPKQATKLQYEILPDDGSGTGDNTASHTPHGNEGRRVWNVLTF